MEDREHVIRTWQTGNVEKSINTCTIATDRETVDEFSMRALPLTEGCCQDNPMAESIDCCSDADDYKTWLPHPQKEEYHGSNVTQTNDNHYNDVTGHTAH